MDIIKHIQHKLHNSMYTDIKNNPFHYAKYNNIIRQETLNKVLYDAIKHPIKYSNIHKMKIFKTAGKILFFPCILGISLSSGIILHEVIECIM